MPDKQTLQRARRDRAAGKAPSTQAGEFIREEIHHIRQGKHGARSAKQAIAIGLAKARRAGVNLPPPKRGAVSKQTRKSARYAYDVGQGRRHVHHRPNVAKAVLGVLRHESRQAASHQALAKHARAAAAHRTRADRSASARQAVRTKGAALLSPAAKKAARTRTHATHA